MAVELIDTLHHFTADIEKEGVSNLVHNVGQDEVECVAEIRTLISHDFLVPKLIDRETNENQSSYIHNMPHQLSNLFVVFEESSCFFRVEIADLKENNSLHKA